MCGIVGIYDRTGAPVNGRLLKEMADKIHHRGPDDEGMFLDNSIGLYHKRLSIIDLATGHQPMIDDDYVIVFNGEIYNYIELREELISKGHSFKTSSDTEVILKVYRAYGEAGISMLNGMFAFLLYDQRKKQLIAARDHFGIKPLYFYQDDRKTVFASEIKAILEDPEIVAELNQDALNQYITFQFVLQEQTLFQNIKKLLPGQYMVIDLDSQQTRFEKYWEPNFKIDHHHTMEYFVYQLQELLEDTIKMQLRSDVPLGTYLSGGMDSSLVSVIASRHLPHQLKTFTGAFEEGRQFDESQYAEIVANFCKAEMHKVFPNERQFIDLLPKLIYHMDEPAVGPGLFPQYMVSKLASENVKVVLGGQGGDEIFGGYTRYVIAYLEQVLKGAIFETNDEGEHIVSLESIIPNLSYLKQYVPMMKNFWKKEVFEPMDRRYFHLIDRSESTLSIFTPAFQQQFCKEGIFGRFQKSFNHPDTLSYFNKMTHFDMLSSLPGLLQVEDRVSMAVSIESRVPLLDRRIVDLVCSMPVSMKFKGGQMKYVLKKATKSILPKQIFERKDKMGFPVPLHIWAKNGASGFIRDVLLSKQCRERGIFDTDHLEKLIQSERAFGRALWGALSLELWFQQFIDQ